MGRARPAPKPAPGSTPRPAAAPAPAGGGAAQPDPGQDGAAKWPPPPPPPGHVPVAGQARIWAMVALALALVLWLLGDIVLPFVIGAGMAYFLNPLVEALVRRGLSRGPAVGLIALMALGAVVLAVLAVVPALIGQGRALVEAAPAVFAAAAAALTERFPDLMLDEAGLRAMLAQAGDWARAQGGEVLNRLLASARSVLSVVLLLVVVPVVTVYLLLDWPRMLAAIDRLLPRRHAPTIRHLGAQIDRSVAAYIRGMGTVCLAMACYYGIGLMAVGLQFGLVVGALAGLLTFIPYVGAVVGGVLVIALALYQFWGEWLSFGLVIAVFAAGQMVESNVVTPRVLGQAIGVHPVWLLFAISVFGALFGLVGMLVAVPLAAAAAVLVRHAVTVYEASPLYLDTGR
jgi:predicted PurR-regulated permease PerM